MKRFLLTTTLLFLAVCATAQTTSKRCPAAVPVLTPDTAQARMAQSKDQGFLYQYSKDGQQSWLYGTIHVGTMETLFPGPSLRHIFQQSKALVLEIDPTQTQAIQLALTQYAQSTDNLQLVSAARKQLIDQAAQHSCTDPASLSNLPVALQMVTLAINPSRFDGLYTEMAQEMMLLGFATSLNKPVMGLETIDQQLRALAGPNNQYIADLDQMLTVSELNKGRQTMLQIMDMWRSSRYDLLHSYYQWCDCANTAQDKAYLKYIIDDRNKAMVSRSIALHEQFKGGVLIAVGSLHLIGETGYVQALQAAGYEVKRLY